MVRHQIFEQSHHFWNHFSKRIYFFSYYILLRYWEIFFSEDHLKSVTWNGSTENKTLSKQSFASVVNRWPLIELNLDVESKYGLWQKLKTKWCFWQTAWSCSVFKCLGSKIALTVDVEKRSSLSLPRSISLPLLHYLATTTRRKKPNMLILGVSQHLSSLYLFFYPFPP